MAVVGTDVLQRNHVNDSEDGSHGTLVRRPTRNPRHGFAEYGLFLGIFAHLVKSAESYIER